MNAPAAVLWDLDGTIVDTEPLWMDAERRLATEHGADWTEADGLALVGSELITAAAVIKSKISSSLTPQEIVDRLVSELAAQLRAEQTWQPGAVELIQALAEAGIPQALVTMSYREIAEPVLEQLPFNAVVTGDIVERGKPHPEPYLTAARLLDVDPTQCLAIEDSPTGVASAEAAGCRVLVIPHVVDVPAAPGRLHRETLAGLTPSDLRGR